MHLAAARDLLFADDGNIVLGLTRNRARAAPDACPKVDNHPPGVAAVLEFIRLIECLVAFRFFFRSRDAFRIGYELSEGSGSQKIAAFHLAVPLRRGEE